MNLLKTLIFLLFCISTPIKECHRTENEEIENGNCLEKAPKTIYWAVAKGHKIGVFKTWAECLSSIRGHSDVILSTFDSEEEAKRFLANPEAFGLSLDGGAQKGQREYWLNNVRAVFTDGSTSWDGKQTSIGLFWGDGDERNTGEIIPDAKPQTGELHAIIRGMEIGQHLEGMAILTDYQGALNVISKHLDKLEPGNDEWRYAQEKRIKHIGLYRRIKQLRQQFLDRRFPVYFEKVDAHSGVYGNNQADRLARKARNIISHYVVPNYGFFTKHSHSLMTGEKNAKCFRNRLQDAIEYYDKRSIRLYGN